MHNGYCNIKKGRRKRAVLRFAWQVWKALSEAHEVKGALVLFDLSWIGMWRVRRRTRFILRSNSLLIYFISIYAIRIKIQFCIWPSINPRVLTRLLFAKDLWVRKSDRSFHMVIPGIILSPGAAAGSGPEDLFSFFRIQAGQNRAITFEW